MKGRPINYDLLHRVLWRRADHFGRLRISVDALTEELDLANHSGTSRMLQQMVADGRIRMLSSPRRGEKSRTYHVIDPAVWAQRSAG